ncbi:hypothetical protein C8A05DRAFT_15732 [Staphylotrichum tortipilum]|uniref:Oxidase ustYa n=1 Tax=Staphylotrichum tortipilum TaxID=2831512 RepID=A0AAN6RT95_9PEZI|nr:hypothetical protein C8A05DRAFT_15732 [Staphylotrichum longicolle]
MEPTKHEGDEEEEEAFLRRPSDDVPAGRADTPSSPSQGGKGKRVLGYLRILLEIAMTATIAYLVIFKPFAVSRETIRRTPVPKLPRKIYTFQDNPKYVRGDMWFNESLTLHTLHNWIELSSASRGYVVIKNPSNYDLPEPYTVPLDRHNDGPGYMVTVFHQLHCLSYLAEHYQQGYAGVQLSKEVAHHTAHCFNYIRQGIMCSADTTLEGHTEAGPGEGSEHECTDYEALLEWANKNSAMKWRETLLPEESTL